MADFYSVLGLTKSATKDDIKKAYRKLALKTHPDRVPAEQKKSAEEAFRQVNAAYEILHDDKNRKLYDAYGTWPPPEEPTRSSRSQRKTQDQQRNYSSQHYYEPPPPTFVFTDPFQLFNQLFAEFNIQMNQFHQAAAAATHARHNSAPVYPDPFGSFGAPFAGYPPPAAYPSFAAHPYVTTTAPPVPSSLRPESTFQNAEGGWIKESKVTKVTPTGQRETTIKKTDYNGVVYITRIAGDGSERHFTLYNGVEASSPHPIPRVAPPPGSAPPAPHRPSPSKKPSPSSSTTKSSEPPITPTRSQSDSYHHPRPTRAENPVPLMASIQRTTSPAPLSAPAGTQGAHGFPFDQVPATKRPSSPQPIPRVTSPDPTSLRRQATMPSYQAAPAQAGMPRPQSPHFYRPRVTSEAVKAPNSKLKTSYSMPPTTDYASAPEMQTRSSSRAQYATAQDPRREPVAQSMPGSRSASHSRKSSRSNLASDYQKAHAYQAAPPAEAAAYTTTRSSSRGPPRERTMDAVFDAAPAPPLPQKKHSSHHSVDVKQTSDKYASVPRAVLGANELGLGVSQTQTQNIPSYVTPTRSRSNTHDKRAAEAPPASMLFGTPAAAVPSSSSKHSSSKHHHHHHHTASSSAAMYVNSNPLPHPPSMVNLTSQWTHATDSKRRHQQAV